MLEDLEIPIPDAKLDIITTISELKNQLVAHITDHLNKLYALDCKLAKAEADVEKAQRAYDEAQMNAHNQTKNTPLDLKNLLQVATIVGDTAESIKLNNIFNEVLPSTCKSITTYVTIATDAWKGDNVLDPTKNLDPDKTSIPALEDPDNKKVKKAIKEDTEAWFMDTALDEDGNEHEDCYNNLQVLFQGALKAKLKGKDKEVAKAAQEFIDGPAADNPVEMFFDDFELEKEDKEIF